MPVAGVVLFFFSVLAGGVLLALAFRMRLLTKARYLDLFFYFIVVTVSYGFVNWLGLSLISLFADLAPGGGSSFGVSIFTASALPLALLRLFLFVSVLLAVLDQRIPRVLVRSYCVVGAAVVLSFGFVLFKNMGTESIEHVRPYLILLGVLIIVMDYLAIGYFLTQANLIEDPLVRRYTSWFGWAYLLGYLAYTAPFYASYWFDRSALAETSPYVYYLMHIVPMVFLQKLSIARITTAKAAPHSPPVMAGVVEKYGISKREEAVLELVLAGLNNEETSQRLFISPHTVRNHIYSIYQKIGVKNRIQLLSACSPESHPEFNDQG
jgi:DNA-binding CsgD family transcriptional regulator